MNLKEGLGVALRAIRKHKGLSQEDFSDVSGRTYMSALERGMYSPTVDKLDELASVMGVHPVTLLVASYMKAEPGLSPEELMVRVRLELEEVGLSTTKR
jgi:transcriptional regulator with XRE-family HTH domain